MHFQRFAVFLCAGFLLTGCASRICEVHHERMSRTRVPVYYGLFRPNDLGRAREAASTNAFPHAEDWVGGGCVVPLFFQVT
jgi:hypothetical protein